MLSDYIIEISLPISPLLQLLHPSRHPSGYCHPKVLSWAEALQVNWDELCPMQQVPPSVILAAKIMILLLL